MAKSFKVGYKTRQKLQKAIMAVIKQEGLLDTYALLNSVRISSVSGDLNSIDVTINAIYYYMFLDKGASKAGTQWMIAPFKITEKAINSPLGQEFVNDSVEQYIQWLTNNFPILQVARISSKPKMKIRYNLYGSPDPKWNGLFD